MPSIQLRGYIRDYKEVGEGRKKRLVAYFTDGTGTIELVWFRSLSTIQRLYPVGQVYLICILQWFVQYQPSRGGRGEP